MDKIIIVLLNGATLDAVWPSDEQWIARNRRRKLIQRTVKGETTHDVENGDEADLDLFREIVSDPNFNDAAEASLAIEQLGAATVTGLKRTGEAFAIEVDTFLGPKTVELKRPTAAQVKRYRTFVTTINGAFGRTELRTNLNVPATLFDEMGGDKDWSIIFKVAAASAAIAEVQHVGEASNRP